jgi:hypothetical protein
MWQDIAITILSICFVIALIPQISNGFKTKKSTVSKLTALITFVGAYIMAFVFFTLELYSSTIVQSIAGTFWFIIFIQSIIYRNN